MIQSYFTHNPYQYVRKEWIELDQQFKYFKQHNQYYCLSIFYTYESFLQYIKRNIIFSKESIELNYREEIKIRKATKIFQLLKNEEKYKDHYVIFKLDYIY